jgi:hypothetical protein
MSARIETNGVNFCPYGSIRVRRQLASAEARD